MRQTCILTLLYFFCVQPKFSAQVYTKQDSVRGSITKERSWWDLKYYKLEVTVDPKTKSIHGKNTIHYKVLEANKKLQIDLQPPMQLTKATQGGKSLKIDHDGNAHYIQLEAPQLKNSINSIDVHFKGHPKAAVRPPWDGGFIWRKDQGGTDFIATACQ